MVFTMSGLVVAEQETLEGGELGVPACPARDTWKRRPAEQKRLLGHISLPPRVPQELLLSRAWALCACRGKMKKPEWLAGTWDTGWCRVRRRKLFPCSPGPDPPEAAMGGLGAEPICTSSASLKCKYGPTGVFNSALLSTLSLRPGKEIPNLLRITACTLPSLSDRPEQGGNFVPQKQH